MANRYATISKKDRFDIAGCKTTMKAVVTNGNGGYEQLEYRDVPIPTLAPGEVLLQVLAAGVNNTEINTLSLANIKSAAFMPNTCVYQTTCLLQLS